MSAAADGIALHQNGFFKKIKKNKKKLRYSPSPSLYTHTRRIIPVLHGNLLRGHPLHQRREAACFHSSISASLSRCCQSLSRAGQRGPGRFLPSPSSPKISDFLEQRAQGDAQLYLAETLLMLLDMGGFNVEDTFFHEKE